MDVYTGRVLTAEEATARLGTLPQDDLTAKQPEQYRPPTQKDPWSPQPPVIGQRTNPLTGQTEPRAFPKSYGCDGGNDYGFAVHHAVRHGRFLRQADRKRHGAHQRSAFRLYEQYHSGQRAAERAVFLSRLHVQLSAARRAGDGQHAGSVRAMDGLGHRHGRADPARRHQPRRSRRPDDQCRHACGWTCPASAGPRPRFRSRSNPAATKYFYQHSLRIEGGQGWPWVVASGATGLSAITVQGLKPGQFLVRLYFAEPSAIGAGERVFDVALQGQRVLEAFDIAAAAGGPLRGVVREFRDVASDGQLRLEFQARVGEPLVCGLELIATGLTPGEVPVLTPDHGGWAAD